MSDPVVLSRRFTPLFLTQLFAALNDSFLKNTLIFFVLMTAAATSGPMWVTLAGGVFMLPAVFLSGLGGEMADKFDKASVARKLKLAEIGAAAVAVAGLYLQSLPVLMASLFLFGVGSALFSPIKYGILPDHLTKEELPKANAWIEAATFVAILSGAAFAGLFFKFGDAATVPFAAAILGVSALCYVSSRFIPSTAAADAGIRIDPNVVLSTWHRLRELHADSRLFRTSMIVSFFWLCGAVALSVVPSAVYAIGGDEIAVTVYTAVFAVAISAGSAFAAWLCGGRVILLPAVVGALAVSGFSLDFGLTLSAADLHAASLPLSVFFSGGAPLRIAFDVAMMAFFGAFIAVPAFAALQTWAADGNRGRIVSANNILNAVAMVLGAGVIGGLQAAGLALAETLYVLSGAAAAAAVVIFAFLPTSAGRDALWMLFRLLYRIEVRGLENLKAAGSNPVIALKHISFLDAAVWLAVSGRDIDPVFAINTEVARKWWVRPFLKVVSALPLDPTKPMATRTLIRVVESGKPIGIFPEGRISVTGSLMKVYDGAAMVADKTGSLILPVDLDGLEKTHFSRLAPHQVKKRFFPKVRVNIVEPVSLSLDPALKGRKRRNAAGAALYSIMSDLVFTSSIKTGTILEETVNAARTFGMEKIAVQDPQDGDLTYGRLLTGARVLGVKLRKRFPKEKGVGLMLPNSIGATVTLMATMSAGLVPSMINFTAGANGILLACTASKTNVILTSRRFVAKGKLEGLMEELSKTLEIVYLEDIRATVTLFDKLVGSLLKTRAVVSRRQKDAAVVIYTSGSEGTPKGVQHSHFSILANAAQAAARIDFNSNDKVFNILPMFHAFGLGAGTILPLTHGVPIYMYPSPLHYRIVPELIYASNATIIFGTDTFLAGYAVSANAYDFRSIRYCFAGAEPVRPSTRETYMNKFGIRILEGYGLSECAPVVALNTPLFNKPGTLGKLLPAIAHKLVPYEGMEPAGELWIKGPNLMMGYLRVENPGVLETLEKADGWFNTGDIVEFDEDMHPKYIERSKEIANIAGEKISLRAVTLLVEKLWPTARSTAVTVKDERKGEQIVLVTEDPLVNRNDLIALAKQTGVSMNTIPAKIVVEKIPVLGSGKTDKVSVKKMVAALHAA